MKEMFTVNVRSWQWSGASAQQSVGDNVKTAASIPEMQPVATEAAAASGPGDQRIVYGRPQEALERSLDVKDIILYTASDYNTAFGRFRCAGWLFQPSSIDKEASGNRDTSLQNVMRR